MSVIEPTWLYHPTEPAKIVDLGRGAPAPKGWSRDPSVIEDESKRTGDALSGIVAPIVYGDDITAKTPGEEQDASLEVESLRARVAELDVIIMGGMSENDRLNAELSGAADLVEDASREIEDLKAQVAGNAESEALLRKQLQAVSEELAGERTKTAPLGERIARLERDLEAMTADRDRLKAKRDPR